MVSHGLWWHSGIGSNCHGIVFSDPLSLDLSIRRYMFMVESYSTLCPYDEV